ncbi:hypothetical protein KKF38_02505 [Patescibacteria group bacterium]|nr:hypothetical protein [Patescibacteria group bacterium]
MSYFTKIFLAMVLAVVVIFAATPAMSAGVPLQLTKVGDYYKANEGSYLDCSRILFAATGDLVNGAPVVRATGVRVNGEGLMFESSSTDANDNPIWIAIVDVTNNARLDLRTVKVIVCCEDNVGLLIKAANGDPVMRMAGDLNLQRVQQSLVEKSAALIAAAQSGTKIDPVNLPPEVLAEMVQISKKYTQDRFVAFLKSYGKLLNWTDADIARLINLLSTSRIDAFIDAMKWAERQEYAVNGTPTTYSAAMQMSPKYDATTRGTIYFDFNSGTHKVSGMRLDSSFQIRQIVKDGKFFVVALQDDGTPLSGQLFVDMDGNGNWVSGMAPMSERAEILPPTLVVRQAAALELTEATAGGNTKSAVKQPGSAVQGPQ